MKYFFIQQGREGLWGFELWKGRADLKLLSSLFDWFNFLNNLTGESIKYNRYKNNGLLFWEHTCNNMTLFSINSFIVTCMEIVGGTIIFRSSQRKAWKYYFVILINPRTWIKIYKSSGIFYALTSGFGSPMNNCILHETGIFFFFLG